MSNGNTSTWKIILYKFVRDQTLEGEMCECRRQIHCYSEHRLIYHPPTWAQVWGTADAVFDLLLGNMAGI